MYLQISVSQVRNITRHSIRTQDRRSRLLSRFSVRLRRVTVKLRAFLTLKDTREGRNVCDRLVARRLPPCGARAAGANGRGRRSTPPREPQQTAREGERCSVAHASSRGQSLVGGGPQYGGRLAAAGAAAVLRVQRERRVRRVQRVERLQRAAQSAAHAPRPTPSAAPSHARWSTLCTLTDQLLLSAGHRCETVSRPKVLPFLR